MVVPTRDHRAQLRQRVRFSWALGRTLTITGFHPLQAVLDLGAFWVVGQIAQVLAGGVDGWVLFDFIGQQILLLGVEPGALDDGALQTWTG